jgi:hypothetical protein
MWPFSKKEKREPEPLAANARAGPPVFITYRADPVHNGDHDPQSFTRYRVDSRADFAPAPVPYTQWWSVGRDPEHAWPHHQLYQFLSPRDWLSVAGWPFSSVGHTQAGSMVYMPNGTFIPQVGRSNITAPPQTSLGAQNAVQAPVTIDANHLKLYR